MSKDESQVPKKKSFIERMTGTTAQIAALIIALSGLFTQIPVISKTVSDAYCSIFSCAKPQEQPPAPAASTPSSAVPANDKIAALQAVGINRGVADPDWFNNEFTSYPFIADALLTLLQGKHLARPVDIDVVVWNYENTAPPPRSASDVDLTRLKTAVLAAYNERYGETESDFAKIAR